GLRSRTPELRSAGGMATGHTPMVHPSAPDPLTRPRARSLGPGPAHLAPGPLTWPRARSLGPQHRFLAGQIVLRRRLEGAGHAVETVVAVPVGILGQELLMLRLGRVVDAVAGLGERSQLRGDATATSCV